MKTFLSLIALLFSTTLFAQWDNPAVQCPEDILPKGIECLNLERVQNPLNDFPDDMPESERRVWRNQRTADLKLCRHQELLRREDARPGSFTPLQVQIAWMTADGGRNSKLKLQSMMNASVKYQIPPHVMIGALTQESLLSSLGVSPDGGNYSCGIAQLNIQEWCQGMNTLSEAERTQLGWPKISCTDIPTDLVAPFYDIGFGRLGDRPDYRITATDFDGITFEQVSPRFPSGSVALQQNRFKAVTSFLKNCQNDTYSIAFKAKNLAALFANFVPAPLKAVQTYGVGQTFSRSCASPYPSKYYPLHVGWLLAVAMYNAGPRQPQLVEHYFQVKDNAFPAIGPQELIEALHWGGKYREGTNRIYFAGQNGVVNSQLWYKSCVVQRHVARVVQHVSQPGVVLAKSLEQAPCAPGSVPSYRRKSSGIK